MHVFGWGDLAWRFYDYTLMGVWCGAMVAIAMPYDWLAGLFSGVVFDLSHTCEGARHSSERDEAMTALMVLAYAFLFSAVRHRSPWRMVMFGLSMGMAATIKPTISPLGFALLLLAYWALRKERLPAAPYLVAGCAGAAIAAAIIVAFFLRYNSFAAFYEISRTVTVHYASLHRESLGFMLRTMLPKVATVLLPFALLAAIAGRQWNSWERNALLLGALFGAFSYFAQGKGYGYHRYPFTAFIVLWESIELTLAMRRERWIKGRGFAGMAVGVFLMVPAYAYRLAGVHPVNEYAPTLESDLNRLGGDRLQGQVQCFDMVDGCFNALYHLRLVQATTALGDTLYFSREANPTVDRYRAEILNQLSRNPPQVIVVSDEWYNETDSELNWISGPSSTTGSMQTTGFSSLAGSPPKATMPIGFMFITAPAYNSAFLDGPQSGQQEGKCRFRYQRYRGRACCARPYTCLRSCRSQPSCGAILDFPSTIRGFTRSLPGISQSDT